MNIGLSPADLEATEAQMAGSYRTRSRLHLLDLNHTFLMDLSDVRIDAGSVAVQADQPVSRSIGLGLFDPTDVLGLTRPTSVGPTFLLQAWKGIYVDALDQWVDFPVICAYVTKPSRSGDTLTIEAQDKAALASLPATAMTLKKGTNVGSAIRSLLQARCGESRFRFASTSTKLTRDYALDDSTTPWALAKSLAAVAKWDLFYDAEGYCVGRPASSAPVFTFRSGIGGTLVSGVSTGYWDGDLFNRVIVTGPVVKGVKVTATATLPASHPLSPENLRRNGVAESGFRTFRYQSSSLTDRAKAGDWAEDKLRQLALQQQAATFDSVPVWHLQENDTVRVVDALDEVDVSVKWTQASIPMTCDGAQSNGHTRRGGSSFSRARVKTTRTRAKKRR